MCSINWRVKIFHSFLKAKHPGISISAGWRRSSTSSAQNWNQNRMFFSSSLIENSRSEWKLAVTQIRDLGFETCDSEQQWKIFQPWLSTYFSLLSPKGNSEYCNPIFFPEICTVPLFSLHRYKTFFQMPKILLYLWQLLHSQGKFPPRHNLVMWITPDQQHYVRGLGGWAAQRQAQGLASPSWTRVVWSVWMTKMTIPKSIHFPQLIGIFGFHQSRFVKLWAILLNFSHIASPVSQEKWIMYSILENKSIL